MYNTRKAIEAQKKYCFRENVPMFAPGYDGRCFHCGKDIYDTVNHAVGIVTGFTVEDAGRIHITACPHCRFSFVD